MNEKFQQKDNHFNKFDFTLHENYVEVKQKNLFKSTQYNIDYEFIGFKTIKTKKPNTGWLIASSILLFFAVFFFLMRFSPVQMEKNIDLFYFSLSLACGTIYFFLYRDTFFITQQNNNGIEFLEEKPSFEELNSFIKTLKSKRNSVLLIKYGQINKHLNYELQFTNLGHLRDLEVINLDEYQAKLQELNKIFNKQEVEIGFNIKRGQ